MFKSRASGAGEHSGGPGRDLPRHRGPDQAAHYAPHQPGGRPPGQLGYMGELERDLLKPLSAGGG